MAMVMLGMFALNPVGITGSIVQQLNHGISTGALFLLVGIVYERRHTREISEYGGLSKVMPVYAAIFLVMTMSSIGLPALNGFIGELLILQGVFVANKMWAAFAGERRRARRGLHAVALSAHDVRQDREPEERAAAGSEPPRVRDVRAAADPGGLDGLYPAPFLRRLETSVKHVILRVSPQYRRRRRVQSARRPPRPIAAAGKPAAKFLSTAPCDVTAIRSRRRRRDRNGADAAGNLAHRFLLHPAGAGAHGRRAAGADRGRAAAARQAAPRWLGHAAVLGATAGVAAAVRERACGDRAWPDCGRSVRAVLQGHLPRRGGDDRADVGALSRDRRARARASITS